MKLNYALILSIVMAIGLVVVGFTYYQSSTERAKLDKELENRAGEIAGEIVEGKVALLSTNKAAYIHILDSLCRKYHLSGIVIYYGSDSIISNNAQIDVLKQSEDFITQSIAADSIYSGYFNDVNSTFHQYIQPVRISDFPNIAVVLYTDADYIDNIIRNIWLRNFIRWFLQALVVSFITLIIIRWGIFSPIEKIVEWLKAAQAGNYENLKQQTPARFLKPLHGEIVRIAKAMQEAKDIAEEEAKLRSHAEAIWTPERLKVEVGHLLQGKKLTVVSNREPYMHIHEGKTIKCIVPASGMITAIEPIIKACGGLWIASGAGDADKETVNDEDKLQVPPQAPAYTLRRLWQTKEEEDHYYYGFANEGLWPLCHVVHTRPIFREQDWYFYQKVNQDFADAVIEETADDEQPFVLIQDYHFALLPQMIKKKKPGAKVAIFWHIPWPNPESFGICPWQKELLEGMLGADLIGFHTQYHCNNFLDTVNNVIESRVLWEKYSVQIGGHTTLVKPFPISIAFTLKDYNKSPDDTVNRNVFLNELGIQTRYLGVGVDRMDYTKGITEKFLGIERFLEKYPQYINKFSFVQIGAPTRTLLKTYSDTVSTIEKEAERINWRFKTQSWRPITLLKRHHSHEEIIPFYEAADFCMVTSLHDGMNLVAKEFVAARSGNNGNLILSRFAGAAGELHGALVVNPYDIEMMADTIKQAIEMSAEEQHKRMNQMRQEIVNNNIYGWGAHLLRSMVSIPAQD